MVRFIFVGVLALLSTHVAAQPLPAGVVSRIDSTFSFWNGQDKPGVVVTVLRGGQPVYQKSFGMANIRKGEALTPAHRFWVASMTKQFTAAGIALLAEEGKLNVEDDIRQYLPELPFMGDTVRIRHLVHHTSGLREGFTLVGMQLKGERHYTNQQVLEQLCSQRSLNFAPGTRFEYNNSGYILLAEIVARASGLPFPEYVRRHIFLPLGMHQSQITGKLPGAGKGMALGYKERSGRYRRTGFKGNTYGSTGLVTTLSDLAKWDANFYSNRLGQGRPALIQQLMTPAVLQSGKPTAYAYGLEVVEHKGAVSVSHLGADPGYKAEMVRFPGHHLTIICLSNAQNNYSLTQRLLQISDWLLDLEPDHYPALTPAPLPDTKLLTGFYLHTENKYKLQHITEQNGELFAASSLKGYKVPLMAVGPGTFRNRGLLVSTLTFQKSEDGRAAILHYSERTGSHTLQKLEPLDLPEHELKRYKGNYYCPELNKVYRLRVRKGRLGLRFFGLLHVPLQALEENLFLADLMGNNSLVFKDDLSAFTFNREGISNLLFIRKPGK